MHPSQPACSCPFVRPTKVRVPLLARTVSGPLECCHSAIISRICVVITDTELCIARTSASGSTLLMETILGWWKSHSAVVMLF